MFWEINSPQQQTLQVYVVLTPIFEMYHLNIIADDRTFHCIGRSLLAARTSKLFMFRSCR